VTDTGAIALLSNGDATSLVVSGIAVLKGTGALTMTDWSQNAIVSDGAAATLGNAATIAGSGEIGDGNLTLVNQAGGVIDATGSNAALTINTGANSVRNSGLIEATGAAGLAIAGALVNNGALAVSAGTFSIGGTLSGTGSATISGGAILDIGAKVLAGGAIGFAQGSTGALKLDQAQSFAGTVAGLAAGDAIDLANFQLANKPTLAAVSAIIQNGSVVGAAVTVKDGSLNATIDLLNQFGIQYAINPAAYALSSDGLGAHPGTLLQLASPGA
jgi:hypothetical protein